MLSRSNFSAPFQRYTSSKLLKRFVSSLPTQYKLPINSIKPVDPSKVIAYGTESIVLDLPKRNRTEEWFDKSKKVYLHVREQVGDFFEGRWLVADAQTNAYYFFETEKEAETLKSALRLATAYVDCVGREVAIVVDHDDDEIVTDEATLAQPPTTEYQPFPTLSENPTYHVWRSALWLPASWKTSFTPTTHAYMKFDSGSTSVGAPSEVFPPGNFIPSKEKWHRGVGGLAKKRHAKDVTIIHAGFQVTTEVFEYNKWLLGHPWFKHYAISINLSLSPPFTCIPLVTSTVSP